MNAVASSKAIRRLCFITAENVVDNDKAKIPRDEEHSLRN